MNELGYKLLVDKSVKRKVTILSLLLETDHPLGIDYLFSHFDLSKQTFQSDINFLLEKFPENLELVSYKGQPSLKKIESSITISNYINELIKNNPLFLIIKSTFNGTVESLNFYTELLFLSETTLRRHLKVLKKVLAEYHLHLNISPIEIIGPEENIRLFYFDYFRYTQDSELTTVTPEQNYYVYSILKKLNHMDFLLDLDYQRLLSWFIVFEKRVQQKKHVQFTQDMLLEYTNMNGFFQLKQALQQPIFKNSVLGSLNEHELVYVFLTRLDTVLYEPDYHFYTNDFINQLNAFNPIINEFFEVSQINHCLNFKLKTVVSAFLANISTLSNITPLFQKVAKKAIHLAEENHLEVLQNWYQILKNSNFFQFPYEVAASLTLLTISTINHNKHILFGLTGEPYLLPYFKNLIYKACPKNTEITFIFNQPINNVLLEKLDVDTCICNFDPVEKISYCKFTKITDTSLVSDLSHFFEQL